MSNQHPSEAEVISAQKQEIEHLRTWINDLQSGMYINCVYCGHRYGPKTDVPVSMAEVLKEHVETCPKHPMSKLKADVDRLTAALKEIVQEYEEPSGCVIDGATMGKIAKEALNKD